MPGQPGHGMACQAGAHGDGVPQVARPVAGGLVCGQHGSRDDERVVGAPQRGAQHQLQRKGRLL